MKPTESRKWDSSDIEDVKERLPEGVDFGSLSDGSNNEFSLDAGVRVSLEDLKDKANRVEESIGDIVNIEGFSVSGNYVGSRTPHVCLIVKMKA